MADDKKAPVVDLKAENEALKAELAALKAAKAPKDGRKPYTGKARLLAPHFRKGVLLEAGTIVELKDEVPGLKMELISEKPPKA